MKKLSELGISPAPWKSCFNVNPRVFDGENMELCDSNEVYSKEDARLIASAPKLYEAAYDVVTYCEKNHLVPSEQFKPVLARLRAALAEAAGEEVGE